MLPFDGVPPHADQPRPQRILVTNDDGINAPGLLALAVAAAELDADMTVVAPAVDQSGSGAGIRPLLPGAGVAFRSVALPGLDGVPAFCVDCPPALAVLSACLGGGDRSPDLVLSGINKGLNLGVGVLHSGTVGAALTAANLGLPAVAVSLEAGPRPHWSTAAALAMTAARWLTRTRLPVVLNINVPDVALEDLAGVRSATLSRFADVRWNVASANGADDRADPLATDADPESDAALVRRRFATITVLHGLREAGHEIGGEAASFAEWSLSCEAISRPAVAAGDRR